MELQHHQEDREIKTVVLGLGNPILSDDGIGLHIAAELRNRVDQQGVVVVEACLGGLNLLDLLVGYDRAIIVDAIQTEDGKAGQIYRLEPDVFSTTRHIASLHDVDFATALELGNRLGLALPRQIAIFAVEAADISTFSEECTPEVKKAIPTCVEMVIQELSEGFNP